MLFKLLESQHVGPDYSQKPVVSEDPITGEKTEKYPSKVYNKGDVIDSGDMDLAAKLGANKFQLIETGGRKGRRSKAGSDEPQQGAPLLPTMAAPHGQVSQGHQVATVSPDGIPGSRAMTAEEAAEAGLTDPPTSYNSATLARSVKPSGSEVEEENEEEGGEKKSKAAKQQKLSEQYVLDEMTKAELEELAEQEEVDLAGCHTKADILKVLKKH